MACVLSAEPPLLVGQRCTLRELRPDDAPAIARHADDVAVWRNLYDGFPHPYTLAEAQAWCEGGFREPQFGTVWAIDVGGEAIGCIGLHQLAAWFRCNAEVGYWIGQAFWGRGIASEALGMVTAWAWLARPELTRLVAPIFARNLASQRVAVKCGYALEGVLRQSIIKDGQVTDLAQYAASRDSASR
jgi:ribosomal-protein-alanine N-acetyltransferase